MTIKDTLQSFESEIVILVAIAVGLLIAVKVISAFVAGARWRAANAAAQAAAVVASPGNAGPAAAVASSGSGGLNSTGVTAVINNYLVSVPHFAMTDIDEKSAALVLAIVAHDSGIPLQELQVKSIKAIG